MAKRKKSKQAKKPSQARPSRAKGGSRSSKTKASGTRTRPAGAPALAPEDSRAFTQPGPSLTPAPALPTPGQGTPRERRTRGGKSTLPMRELLAEVPTPTRSSGTAGTRPSSPHGQPMSQSQIYETLAALLVPYARKMESEMHPKIGFCLKVRSARTGRETHFGGVQALADGVAFHLFPLYAHPDLLEGLSPELFNRMRGKTCFHFEGLDAGLVAELAQLTHAGFERFLSDGVF